MKLDLLKHLKNEDILIHKETLEKYRITMKYSKCYKIGVQSGHYMTLPSLSSLEEIVMNWTNRSLFLGLKPMQGVLF